MAQRNGTPNWSLDEEDELVRLLITGEVAVSFETTLSVRRCAFALTCKLERKFNKYFGPDKVCRKLVSMLRRYRLFSEFIWQPNINYNRTTNVVTYNVCDWPQIISINNGFALYSQNGERQWIWMCCLFSGRDLAGLNAMAGEGNIDAPIYIDSDTSEEYHSPVDANAFEEHIASTEHNCENIAHILSSDDENSRAPLRKYAPDTNLRRAPHSAQPLQPSSSNDSELSTARTRRR